MIILLLSEFTISPFAEVTSQCNITLSSDVLMYSECIKYFNTETTIDYEGTAITVLGAPLDPYTCSRYLFKMDNAIVKNANFYLNTTIEKDGRCPRQYFGVFDTFEVNKFRLENVYITGNVYIEKDVDAVVGSVFAFEAMQFPPDENNVYYSVPIRGGSEVRYNQPSAARVAELFDVGYDVKVFKLTIDYFDELPQRRYQKANIVECTSWDNETAFTNDDYLNKYFIYSAFAYETLTPVNTKKYSRSTAFSIYQGSELEQIPSQFTNSIATGATLPGVDTVLARSEAFNAERAAECLDAQVISRGPRVQVDMGYDVFINSACDGCKCRICPNLIVAKPNFESAYCTETCPEGSVRYSSACIGSCPINTFTNNENTCVATFCEGFQIELKNGECQDATVTENGTQLSWPHRKVLGIDGKVYEFGGDEDFTNAELRAGCPVVLGFKCYKECPPGYETKQVYGNNGYINMECHSCQEFGLHGWYAGKCWSACPNDELAESGICVSQCSPGKFNNNYFCLAYCTSGYILGGECVEQCPESYVIGRDIKQCFHDCPSNLQYQDGVCVYQCDYGLEFDVVTGLCSPCKSGYAWGDSRCEIIGSKDCSYTSFENGLLKCQQQCEYGQLKRGSECVSLDKEEGNFDTFESCDFIEKAVIWNEQLFCYLEQQKSDFIANIHELHQISECEFSSIDIGDSGSLKNVLFAYNITMQMPQECEEINITLFQNAKSIENISVVGIINITNTKSKQVVKYAFTEKDPIVNAETKEPLLKQSLLVLITGGTVNITDTLASKNKIESLTQEEMTNINKTLVNFTRSGGQYEIYYEQESTLALGKISSMLEFFDDSDSLKLVVEREGNGATYYTSAIEPKIFSKDDGSVIECPSGSAVKCAGLSCTCQQTLAPSDYLYGITIVQSCGNGQYTNKEQQECYDICPDAYGVIGGSKECEQCEYYSFYGKCVKACPGFSYGKTCVTGQMASGLVSVQNTTIKCGDSGTEPFFESGKCVEKCSDGLSLFETECVAICPQGMLSQFNTDLGYSECVSECSSGYFEEHFVCRLNCSDSRFKKYRECRYDCDGASFEDQCFSECPIGYENVEKECELCKKPQLYDLKTSTCVDGCESRYIVYSTNLQLCCFEGSTYEQCEYLAKVEQDVEVNPSFIDGLLEQEDCMFMKKSSIWASTKCTLTAENNFLEGMDLINVIGLEMEKVVSSSGVSCHFYALDVDHFEIVNTQFYFDVNIIVPSFCQEVTVGAFGSVDTSKIYDVSVKGSITVSYENAPVPLKIKNVIHEHVDKLENGSAAGNAKIQLFSTLLIAGKNPNDHVGGEDLEILDLHSKKFGFEGNFHIIYYIGDSTDEIMQEYYAVLEFYHDSQDLAELDNAFSSLRPVSFIEDSEKTTECNRGQVLDVKTKQCVENCGVGSKLIGTLCIWETELETFKGQQNQLFTECPRGTSANELSGVCEACPLSHLFENGNCVEACKDGLFIYERECVAACPVNTEPDGIFCKAEEGKGLLEDGVYVKECSSDTANENNSCQVSCRPGQYIKNSECVDFCAPDANYILDGQCLESKEENPCDDTRYLYIDPENEKTCVLSCPASYWATDKICVPESEEKGCNDPMSYRNPILKRCVPCYIKKGLGEEEECSSCQSVNRTNPANLTHQYCEECSFYYIEQTDSLDQIETKFCTDQCPPNPLFLRPEEKNEYSLLKFPLTTIASGRQTTECKEYCDKQLYSNELSNTPECTELCLGGLESKVTDSKGNIIYMRCVSSCGIYPKENPIQGSKACYANCTGNEIYRVPAIDEYGYSIFQCQSSCANKYLYNYSNSDVLCSDSCPEGMLAQRTTKEDAVEYQCVSSCDFSSEYKFENWANNTCVTACENSALHEEVYLNGQECSLSCKYYVEYSYDENDESATKHSVNYQCAESCGTYYIDSENRKICTDSCPKSAKYRQSDGNGLTICVPSCPSNMQFVNAGECVSKCPELYFITERNMINATEVIMKICIAKSKCVSPLATETVEIQNIKYTHCTKCADISLNNQVYTVVNKNNTLSCTSEKCGFYTPELVCLESCPITFNGSKYYQALDRESMCMKCVSSNNKTCLPNNYCAGYINESDASQCVSKCGEEGDGPFAYHYEFDERNQPYKVCGGGNEECNQPAGIKDSEHFLCRSECYQYKEDGETIKPQKYLSEYGCVPDCFEYGDYFPFTIATLEDDDESREYYLCSKKSECEKKYNNLPIITINVSNSGADKENFRPGTCFGEENAVCKSKFYVLDGKISRCVEECEIFKGFYDGAVGASKKCDNSISQTEYLYYDFKYRMFEAITKEQCLAMKGYVITPDNVCQRQCPYELHLQLDGECHRVPQCLYGEIIEINRDQDGASESYQCVEETKEMAYYYLDGKQYVGDSLCTPIPKSKECKILQCPEGFFYLHGTCTKMCANRTADVCADITESNVFTEVDKFYVQIPREHCLSQNKKLYGVEIGGSVIYLCDSEATGALFEFEDGAFLVNSTSCVLNKTANAENSYFVRSLCANESIVSTFSFDSKKFPVSNNSIVVGEKLLYHAQYGSYESVSASESCTDTVCFKQCTGKDEILYYGTCVKQVPPKDNEMYMMYNGLKHKIASSECVEIISGRECAIMTCPRVLIGDEMHEFSYHQGICASGCVKKEQRICQKYEVANIYDPVSFVPKQLSQCNTLVMSANANDFFFSWQCRFEMECQTGYTLVGLKYCVSNAFLAASSSKNLLFSEASVPSSRNDIILDMSKESDMRKCEVFRSIEIGGAEYRLCATDYTENCNTFEYDGLTNAFLCRSEQFCKNNEINYISSGVCSPICKDKQYLIKGQCVTVTGDCQHYSEDGESCVTDTKDKFFIKVGDKIFEIGKDSYARVLSASNTNDAASAVTYVEPFICPMATHYYYRGTCIRRCIRQNDYECDDDTAGKYFTSDLQEASTPSEKDKVSTIDLGFNKFTYEIMGQTSRCKDYEITIGNKCVSKSIILANIEKFEGDCVITSGDISKPETMCSNDSYSCNTFVTIQINSTTSVRICEKDNDEVDCSSSYYYFNSQLERFECKSEECPPNEFTTDGRFCFPACKNGEVYIFNKCVKESEALDQNTTEKYQMAKGKKYAAADAKFSISFEGIMSGEKAFFVCPTGFSYLENRCKQTCPVANVSAEVTGVASEMNLTVCLRNCPFFYVGQGCTDICDSSQYAKLVYTEPYVNYMCKSSECIGTEYTIVNYESTLYPKLCVSKAKESYYPEIPEERVFTYNTKPNSWDDLFIQSGECTTFFRSQVDSKLLFCADVSENVPKGLQGELEYSYDLKMFEYKQCSFGYYMIEKTCYPNEKAQSAYLLDDSILKIYDASKKGSYDITENNTELYYKQGECQIYQYFDGEECQQLPSKVASEPCKFYYSRAAYNTTHELANDAVYFIVDPAKLEGHHTISSTSCEIAAIKCPAHLGYHYFENACVKKCATNTADADDKYTVNCLQYQTFTSYNTVVTNNLITPIDNDNLLKGYKSYTGEITQIEFAEVFNIEQYMVHVISQTDIPQDEYYTILDYNGIEYAVGPEYALPISNGSCVIGMEFTGKYMTSLCTFNCKIYNEKEISTYKIKYCIEPVFPAAQTDYTQCGVYVYDTVLNMYECEDSSALCKKDEIVCQEECIESGSSQQIFMPGVGCAPKECENELAYNVSSRFCSRIKDITTGECNGYFIERASYKGFVEECDPLERNNETCECLHTTPCIMGANYFNQRCETYQSCKYVTQYSDEFWSCGTSCQATYGKTGNLCTKVVNGDKYNVLQMNMLDKTPWYVAIGGIAIFIILGIVMVIEAVVLYRKVNANKSLKKIKRDANLGYHERLNKMSGNGTGKKKVEKDKVQKNVGRRAE